MEDPEAYICPRPFYEFAACVLIMPWASPKLLASISALCRDTYILLHSALYRRKCTYYKWRRAVVQAVLRRSRIPTTVSRHYRVLDEAFADTAGPTRVIGGTDRINAPNHASIRSFTIIATQPYAFYLIILGCGKPQLIRVYNWTRMPSGCTAKLYDRQPGQKTPAGAYCAHINMPIAPIVRQDDVIAYMATREMPSDDWTVRPDIELMWYVITHIIVATETS